MQIPIIKHNGAKIILNSNSPVISLNFWYFAYWMSFKKSREMAELSKFKYNFRQTLAPCCISDSAMTLRWVVEIAVYPLMFFSLDRPVTEHQILNIKCQKSLMLFQFKKRRSHAVLFSFRIKTTTRNFSWHLDFSHRSMLLEHN